MAIIALWIAGSGCAGTGVAASSGPGSSNQTVTQRSASRSSDVELERLYWSRRDSAQAQYVQADVAFMTGMIAHHAQALIMSRMAVPNGAGPRVRVLTSRIMNAQSDEIATMQKWLRDRGEPVPEPMEVVHTMHMTGMLTDAQLDELRQARGTEFDRLFLTYMILHHTGAVSMVDDLFSKDGAGQEGRAFKLASDIHVDQLTEIARMERMLRSITEPGQ